MSAKVRLCAVCKKDISERVEILLETWLCREHAGMIERYGGEFLISSRQESLGKPGSLKKNYGGVSVTKTRNMAGLEKLQAEYDNGLERH
ncbi:MAG TPA: hypothetical protein VN688_19675 [Gemmataceae bacterium]|nr:hypothetical protein [Gemmataceae bacterium]